MLLVRASLLVRKTSIPFLIIGGLLTGATWTKAQQVTPGERQQYEGRIRSLEERLARLEQTVASLSKPSPGAASTETARDIHGAQAAPPPPEQMREAQPAAQTTAMVRRPKFETPPELIPEIGKIGAEVGLLLGGSANPFKLDSGTFAGGFIDLPLFDRPRWLHGKVSYEISIGLSQSQTTFNTTSNVAQVSNLSVLSALNPNGGLANVSAAITGTGAAPFAVTTSTETRLRLLQVVPFAFKYTPTVLDRYRLRPYVLAGFGTYVTIHNQNPARGNPPSYGLRPDANVPPEVAATLQQQFGGQAPFGSPLVAGQIGQSPEITARGLPGGNGNIDIGLHTGAGLAYRLTRTLSLGFDFRYNHIAGSNADFKTYGSRIGFHF